MTISSKRNIAETAAIRWWWQYSCSSAFCCFRSSRLKVSFAFSVFCNSGNDLSGGLHHDHQHAYTFTKTFYLFAVHIFQYINSVHFVSVDQSVM